MPWLQYNSERNALHSLDTPSFQKSLKYHFCSQNFNLWLYFRFVFLSVILSISQFTSSFVRFNMFTLNSNVISTINSSTTNPEQNNNNKGKSPSRLCLVYCSTSNRSAARSHPFSLSKIAVREIISQAREGPFWINSLGFTMNWPATVCFVLVLSASRPASADGKWNM